MDAISFYVVCKSDGAKILLPSFKIKWLIEHATDKPFSEVYDIGYEIMTDDDIMRVARTTEKRFYELYNEVQKCHYYEDWE